MKAPGKAFRKGLTLIEIVDMFPDDASAEAWFEEARWGEAGKPDCCPNCGNKDKISLVPSGKPLPYWCGGCRRNFSVRSGSVMQRSKIPLRKWAIAIYLWATSLKGVSSMKLHRDLGITQKSAYFMAQRLREAWKDMPVEMSGPVEVDETRIGGVRKNMSNEKRKELKGTPDTKSKVGGIKDRGTGEIAVRVLESGAKPHVQGFIRDHAEPGATLYTDEAKAFQGMPEYKHETVNHSVSEYVRKQAHTNGIESFWAALKRAYHGTYHQLSSKHLHRYVQEFASRHNLRPMDTEAIMIDMAARMAGKRLTYKQLIK